MFSGFRSVWTRFNECRTDVSGITDEMYRQHSLIAALQNAGYAKGEKG
jgi:hypothetical protein